MTPQEHQLIVGMFAKHLQMIKALTEAMKSHNLLERGDFQAFMSATVTFAGTSDDLIDATDRQYREIATALKIDLPKLV